MTNTQSSSPRQNDPETIREEGVNVLLVQLLRDHGLSARAERRSRRGVPDVRVNLRGGDLVLLECKWEGQGALLESQLEERLTAFPEALGMLGVFYPDRLRHAENTLVELEAAADLRWWLHGSLGTSTAEPRMRSGSAADLADQLRTLPLELEGVDRVTAAAIAVGYALEQAAKRITGHARISRRVADIIASTDQEKNRAAALRIGCLVLFNALAFRTAWPPSMRPSAPSTRPWGRASPACATPGVIYATRSTTYPCSIWRPEYSTC